MKNSKIYLKEYKNDCNSYGWNIDRWAYDVRLKHVLMSYDCRRRRIFRTVTLLPKRTPEGNRILCVKTNPVTDDMFDIMITIQVALAVLDLQLKEEPMYGNVFMYDMRHVRLSQFLACTPTITKNMFKCGYVSTYSIFT